MDRNYGDEIDRIKEELTQIKKMIIRGQLSDFSPRNPPGSPEVLASEGLEALKSIQAQLIAYTDEHPTSGAIAYTGTFISKNEQLESERQSIWYSVVRTDDMLKLNDNRMVERVLASVGNGQKLDIILALLKHPMTVSQLVASLGARSTGQIYHHLKPLIMADMVKEEQGVYAVIPYRVQGIIMLLAAVKDLIDPHFSAGDWGESQGVELASS